MCQTLLWGVRIIAFIKSFVCYGGHTCETIQAYNDLAVEAPFTEITMQHGHLNCATHSLLLFQYIQGDRKHTSELRGNLGQNYEKEK